VNTTVDDQPLFSLSPLLEQLRACTNKEEKIAVLRTFPQVKEFSFPTWLSACLKNLSSGHCYLVLAVIALGQGEEVFSLADGQPCEEVLREFLDKLEEVEQFYKEVGGLIGYHMLTLELLSSVEKPSPYQKLEEISYHAPEGVDISQEAKVRRWVLQGLKEIESIAEVYPVGGAADRLRLHDGNGVELPAAKLCFLGKTLLEGMVADLQAREYVFYKLFHRQVITPVALMTSLEKDNHAQITSICEEEGWFGRPKESFFLFSQPLVPTMNQKGKWCMLGPLHPLLKPGGHGVIWKLAKDKGVFAWLRSLGRKKLLVRQINNPIAGVDYGLLAFTGIGCFEDKSFGFSSCPRRVKAMEGVNVLIEKKSPQGFSYLLTNIEYCDFHKYHIVDEPVTDTHAYSKFPSNTNILFADLTAIEEALHTCPVPGMLVNMKSICYRTNDGFLKEEPLARLESTMQNIADVFVEKKDTALEEGKRSTLRTFLTHHVRSKTISTVKREYVVGGSLLETPEGCFLDVMANARELLREYCGFTLSKECFFLYHPALGPLYAIIAQKIRGGKCAPYAELQLEIAEIKIENLDLNGSMCIRAENILGHKDAKGVIVYSENTGKCLLKNVSVRNLGIDQKAPNLFWKNEVFRTECFTLIIHGNGEFIAEDVTFEGNHHIEVPEGVCIRAISQEGKVTFRKEPLSGWSWNYAATDEGEIVLS